MHLESVERSK